MAITHDGKYLVSSSYDKTIKIWDIKTGESLNTFNGHNGFITSVIITPDGKYIISGSTDKTIKIWDFKTGESLSTFRGHNDRVSSITITTDGKYLVSGSSDKTILRGIIVIDGAPNISAPVDEAINHATHILLVANPEGQSVKQLAKTVLLLKPDEDYPEKRDASHILRKMFVVLNHAQPESKWDLKAADVAKIVGRPLMSEIPYSETIKQALHGNAKKQAMK